MRRLLRLALIVAFAMLGSIIALPLGVVVNLHAGSIPSVLRVVPQVLVVRAPVAGGQRRLVAQPHGGSAARSDARRTLRPAARAVDLRLPSATIVIPRLGIRAPVYERGVDSAGHLPIAPGYSVTHFQDSAPLGGRGNYVIYGHDDIEGSIFEYLDRLRVGDRVYFDRGAWRFVYRVTGRMVVSPDAVWVLAATPTATLTMISCTPYWVDTQRIVVRAALVDNP